VVDNDHAVRLLGAAARWEALSELTPRGNELLATATTLRLTLTTTVRMIDGIHRHTANVRTTTEPTTATGLAERLLVVITVADFANGGSALGVDDAKFAGRHLQLSYAVFDGHELECGASRTGDLCATSGHQLDAVKERRGWDQLEGEVITNVKIVGRSFIRGEDRVTNLETIRSKDIALLAVRVGHEGDVRGAIWIILEGLHTGGHVEDVAFEIDDTVELFVTAAAMTGSYATVNVTAAGLMTGLGEGTLGALFRKTLALVERGEAAGRRERAE